MDFHSLTRKELQFLCKLNKIAANTKNQVMADALQDLDIVEGIEKFLDVSQSETSNLDESKENVEVSSSKVPITRTRTTTARKVKATEVENLKPTNTRTTRRTAKKESGIVEESKNDALETPALSSTRRKALATSSCRNVNSQLNACDLDSTEDQKSPAAVLANGRRKVATTSTTVNKQSAVQKTYGTRRSTRQTEKKSGEPRVRKESEKAIAIITLSDDENVESDEVSTVEVPECTLNSGIPNAEVEDICNALEELGVVVVVEKEDSGDNLKPESDEISNPHEEEEEVNDGKPVIDGVSSPCEKENFEEELNDSSEEKEDFGDIDNLKLESDEIPNQNEVEDNLEEEEDYVKPEKDGISSPCEEEEKLESDFNRPQEFGIEAVSEMNNDSSIMDIGMILETTENPNESLNSVYESKRSPDEESTNDISLSLNMDEEPLDVIAANYINSVVKLDLMVDEVDETFEENFQFEQVEEQEEIGEFDNLKTESDDNKEAMESMVDETLDAIPAIDSLSPITEEIKNHQPEIFTEMAVAVSGEVSDVFESSSIKENDLMKTPSLSTNMRKTPATVVASSRRKVARPSTTMKNEGTLQKEFSSRRSTRLTEKKCLESILKKEIEKAEKFDLMFDEGNPDSNMEDETVNFQEEQSESFIEDNADVESDETSKTCENVEFEEKQQELELITEEQSESFLEDNADVESNETSETCENVEFEEKKLELITEEHLKRFLEDNADVESDENVVFEGSSSVKETNHLFPNPSTLVDTLKKEFSSRRSTRLTEKSTVINEIEKMAKIDSMLEDVCNSFEKLEMIPSENVDIEEEKLEHSESIIDEIADVESDETSKPCENVDFESDLLTESKVNEKKVDSDSCKEEENQISQNQSNLIAENGVPTPVKKISFVSDDKENKSSIVFGNKERDVMKENLEDVSLRQLRKKLKALTLKTMNVNNNTNNQEARPALQPLCENQMVGGETKN